MVYTIRAEAGEAMSWLAVIFLAPFLKGLSMLIPGARVKPDNGCPFFDLFCDKIFIGGHFPGFFCQFIYQMGRDNNNAVIIPDNIICLLYTSPSPRD